MSNLLTEKQLCDVLHVGRVFLYMDELGDHCTVFPDSVKDWARYNVRRYQDQHAIELFVNVGHLSAVDFR